MDRLPKKDLLKDLVPALLPLLLSGELRPDSRRVHKDDVLDRKRQVLAVRKLDDDASAEGVSEQRRLFDPKRLQKLRKKVGVVLQFPEYQLFEESVEKDVMYGPRNFKVDKETALEKAHEVLDYVGLDESYYKRSPFELSGGEKRRVAIAGVLSFEPDILVLDEPTAGLDPDGQRMILSLLKKMNQDGHTIIIVTHDMDIVLKYCNKVFVLKDGELAFNGTPHELFTNNPSEYSIEIPKLYQLVEALNKKGHHLDASKINNIHDLVSSFKKDK